MIRGSGGRDTARTETYNILFVGSVREGEGERERDSEREEDKVESDEGEAVVLIDCILLNPL